MGYNMSGLLPGDNGIVATVNKMRGAVSWSLQNYNLRKRAETIIANCPERDEQCEARSVFEWVKRHFRYVKDPRGLEMFKSPEVVDQEINERGIFSGDCDDVSGYLAALLASIGYKTAFVIINIRPDDPEYRHIYAKVYLGRRKEWVALEATARAQPFGWEPPNGGRKREFLI